MAFIDLAIFALYFLAMLAVGIYFSRKNQGTEDYYVGGRNMSSWHIGLSVVATDVGGGFSIGLGGLGFIMGLAGSWMLFTGLLGAWISAVFLIPRVRKLSHKTNLLTFPQIFKHYYGAKVALVAGIISAIGYLGFTSSQILAGAKLASASFDGLGLKEALLVMGLIAVVYTVLGGLKAVIYTDTVQWVILMVGLIFVGIPFALHAIGGVQAIKSTLSPDFLSISNIDVSTLVNWAVTIVPIWFVGMTLYQRIYASRSTKDARRAWFIAGLFEWPIMAFTGVLLGLFARVAVENGMFAGAGIFTPEGMDPEMGLPLLLKQVLPIGLMGLVMSSYFSAIMSTADSCLMAASGNVVTDIVGRALNFEGKEKLELRFSQVITMILGLSAIVLASFMTNVLELMLYSYAFMVSGLFIPLLAAIFWKNRNSVAAIWAMMVGGSVTLCLMVLDLKLPYNLDPNIFGIAASAAIFLSLNLLTPKTEYYETRISAY